MVRLVALLLVANVACKKGGDAPASPLQDARGSAAANDALLPPIDAPVAVVAASATKVVVGPRARCALLSDASVRCWGKNDHGQLGDGTTKDSTTPVAPKLRGVKDIVLGEDHACALIDDKSVVCWGKIAVATTAKGDALSPIAASGVNDAEKIFAIGGAGCATEKGGALVCWGDVDSRGHVTMTGARHAPTPVPGVDHVIALTARAALREDGDLVTWLDDGAPQRANVKGMVELAAREDYACALDGKGAVTCFGAKPPCMAAKPLTKPSPKSKPKPKLKPKKGKGKGKPIKPAPPEPAKSEPAPVPGVLVTSVLPLPKAQHLAFDAGACVVTTGKQLICIDAAAAKCSPQRPWPALNTVTQMSGACAVLANGSVRCGVAGTAAAPVIPGATGVTQLSATTSRGCAIGTEGVACWEGTAPATHVAM